MAENQQETTPADSEAKRFEEKRRQFFAAIGQSITYWAGIESTMAQIFRLASNADEISSRYIFWSFPVFSMKMSYTTGVLDVFLRSIGEKDQLKEWDKLDKRLTALYKFRNLLAHQPAIEHDFIYSYPESGGVLALAILREDLYIVPNKISTQ